MKGLIFTYLLTYGGAAASLINPFIGLLIYFAFAIISPRSMWFWSVPAGRYSFIVAVALLTGWGLAGFGSWKFGRARAIVWIFIWFWLWGIISGRFAMKPWLADQWVETQAKILLPFLAGITLIRTVDQVKQIAWVLMLSQAYVAYELNLSYYAGFNRVVFIGFAGMDNNCNAIAMVTGAGLAFFMGLSEKKLWRALLCFVCAALMAHVTMFAMSRGGMLALCVTGIASFILLPKRPKHFFFFAIAVAVSLRLAGPAVTERFLSAFVDEEERDKSAQSRVDMWEDCWDLMLKNPVTGVGPKHWGTYAPEYGWPFGKEAHTLWLQNGAEMGFPGFFLLLAFYAVTMLKLWRFIRGPDIGDPWLKYAARTVIASLIGFCVAASFVSIVGLEIPYYVVLVGAGTLKLVSIAENEQKAAIAAQTHAAAPPPAEEVAVGAGAP